MKCDLWSIPFKFLSLLYKFLNSTTPNAKEKKLHYSSVCTVVVSNNFTKTMDINQNNMGLWAMVGKFAEVKRERCFWNKHWHPSWNVMASWGLLFLWVGQQGLGVRRRQQWGGLEEWAHHTDSPVQFHCEVVAQKSAYRHGMGQEWSQGCNSRLWQQRGYLIAHSTIKYASQCHHLLTLDKLLNHKRG